MRRVIISMLVAISLLAPASLITQPALAVNIWGSTCDKYRDKPPQGEIPAACKDINKQRGDLESNPITKIIRAAINIISIIGGAAAIIMIIVSGIRLSLSRGDSNAASSARSGLTTSLVGLAVIALAQALVLIVVRAI
jgi:hypothetical protein